VLSAGVIDEDPAHQLRRHRNFFTDERNRTYPEGYRISQLGRRAWSRLT
jgi:hypothetical protein